MWDSRLTPEVERIIGAGAPDQAVEDEAPPSVQINAYSALGKELRKWEQHHGPLTPTGTHPGNPYVKREYPKMLYKAERAENGQPCVVKPNPHPWNYASTDELNHAQLQQAGWNNAHQRTVRNESEHRLAHGQGWFDTPTEALEQFERAQVEIAAANAEANFQAKRMSAKAQAEWQAAGDATDAHVVDVQPKKRLGWPKGKPRSKKIKAVTADGPVEE